MAATFDFYFVEMGQGDCCLVRCPDKSIVVVDCGSTGNHYGSVHGVTEGKKQLRAWTAENGNKVDALILTHSDQDHYNKVVDFFTDWEEYTTARGKPRRRLKSAIVIETIYFSNAVLPGRTGAAPLGNYKTAGLNKNVYAHLFSTASIHEVNINSATDGDNHVKTWRKGDGTAKSFTTMDDPVRPVVNKRHRVIGATTARTPWKVEIIAGNVPRGYGGANDAATAENAKSLITLFTLGTRKVLLCGDATFSTEAFLLEVHGATIADTDLVQIPHHGSDYASGTAFINKVNPRAAVVSVNFLEHSYRLPRHSVLQPWMSRIDANHGTLPEHLLDYWVGPRPLAEVQAKQAQWDAAGKERLPHTGWSFAALAQPETNTEIGLYLLLTTGMFLFRREVTTRLTQTAQNTQAYRLTTGGLDGLEYVPVEYEEDEEDTDEPMDDPDDADA
ncbi:MAG TPA: MBL fold metallo-hydrolase [Longimicrobium sp.]